jgi:quercetin dioxygenase-like cupin family protein
MSEHALWVMGGRMTVKMSGQESNGAMSVLEMQVGPGFQAPLHAHAGAEYMQVLEGTAWFSSNGKRVEGGPGTSVVIAADTDETWGSVTAARLLIVSTPAGLDTVFSKFGQPASGPGLPPPPEGPPPPEMMAQMVQFGAEHGFYLRG